MIDNLKKTLRLLANSNSPKAEALYTVKLNELKQVLKVETVLLTEELYTDQITLPTYLLKVEALYSHLKDTV